MKYDFEKKKYICTKCPAFSSDFDENNCCSVENVKIAEQNEVYGLCETEYCIIKQAIARAEKLGDLFGIEEVK